MGRNIDNNNEESTKKAEDESSAIKGSGGEDITQPETWGDVEEGGSVDPTLEAPQKAGWGEYDPGKDQDLHLRAMNFLGAIAIVGIIVGGVLWWCKGDLPDFIGVIVGSAVTAIAALFSKK